MGKVYPPEDNETKDKEEQDDIEKATTDYSPDQPDVQRLQSQAQQAKNALRKARAPSNSPENITYY